MRAAFDLSFTFTHSPTFSFNHFLIHVLTSSLPHSLNLGNEAADADSIVSSICYAYHRHCIDSDCFYIPLVCAEKSKFYLRRDVELLLNHVDISINEDLLSLYDVDWKGLQSNRISCYFTLVDHNVLASKAYNCINYSNLDELIVEILDHHEGTQPSRNYYLVHQLLPCTSLFRHE